jgi:hypothetical protein
MFSRKIGFHALGKFPPGQQYAMTTTFAFQPDIGAKPHDRPFIRTTRMRLAQAQYILELEIRKHLAYGSR